MQTAEGPEPLIGIAVEPRSVADRQKLDLALSELTRHDPAFRFSVDPESGQCIIRGSDEPHLESVIDRIKREFTVAADFGAPQVAYRETITCAAEIVYTHKKQTDGSGQYAEVKIRFEPLPPGSGFEFKNALVGGNVPKEYVPGVEKGIKDAMDNGVIAGFPVIDFKAELVDGKYHDVDSSVLAFEIAARAAFKAGIMKAAPKLLEPIMRVEVVTPEDYMGDVIGDLNSRRGLVIGMDSRGNARVVNAEVPLANLFGFVGTLRSLSQARAQYTIQFDHYKIVPMPDPPPDQFPPAIGMRL